MRVSLASSPKPMKIEPMPKLRKGTQRAKSLTKVLKQSKHVKDLVEECAKDLSTVNSGIKQELENLDSLPGVESALEQNETIEEKVQEVSKKLSVVNNGLVGQVRNSNLLVQQFAAAVEQEEAARHAALHDVLTDLPNRALFDDRLEHGLAHAKRHGWAMAVMFIDLDEFKKINDSYGHDVGDWVLQTVAQRLRENTRSDDTVSRYGGDEFLFLLTEIQDEAHVTLIAEKIIAAVQAPCNVDARDVKRGPRIKASIGIAIFPKDGDRAEILVKKADAAMYRAKRTKSRYAFAE
jgi:diguanylate cyclase (GGDEF)-like protein